MNYFGNFGRALGLGLVLLSSTVGCGAGGLPLPHPYDPTKPYHDDYLNKDVGTKDNQGAYFCSRLASSAQSNSAHHKTAAWFSGALALATAAVAAGLAATDQPAGTGAKNRYKFAMVSLPLSAALFGYLSAGQFAMSDASASASAAAANATSSPKDPDANTTCNAAIATWEADGATSSAPFAAAVGKLTEAQKAQDKADKTQATADTATAAAADAQKKANEDQAKADEALKKAK